MTGKEHKKHESLVFDCPFCQAKADAYAEIVQVRDLVDDTASQLRLLVASLDILAAKIEER